MIEDGDSGGDVAYDDQAKETHTEFLLKLEPFIHIFAFLIQQKPVLARRIKPKICLNCFFSTTTKATKLRSRFRSCLLSSLLRCSMTNVKCYDKPVKQREMKTNKQTNNQKPI